MSKENRGLLVFVFWSIMLPTAPVVAQKLLPLPMSAPEWTRPYEPFRIAGNLYYVGTYDLASYLIATPEGHILINTGLAESVPLIESSVKTLGFKFSDIKILLATHAHYDHVAGIGAIKRATGAKLMIQHEDGPLMTDGGNSDYLFGGKGSTFDPASPDRLLLPNDTVRLGDMKVIALHHPGHTKGATSFLFDVSDGSRSYRVLIANMPTILEGVNLAGMAKYPNVGKDFGSTMRAMKNLQFDLWLASHASQFNLHEKRKPGDAYNPEGFRDKPGYDKAISELNETYLKKLN